MIFRKKHKDESIDEAIDFIKLQIAANKHSVKLMKGMNIDTSATDDWDRIFKNILKPLKSIKEK